MVDNRESGQQGHNNRGPNEGNRLQGNPPPDDDAQRRVAEYAAALTVAVTQLQNGPKEFRDANKRQADLDGWKLYNIGYFQPDLDQAYGSSDMVVLGKDVYWRSVYLFIDAVRDAKTNDTKKDMIAKNFSQLLRGEAQAWWHCSRLKCNASKESGATKLSGECI
ncbi:hypothetical protein AAE478_003408 [Parahypoxylon ruwenzoriense]